MSLTNEDDPHARLKNEFLYLGQQRAGYLLKTVRSSEALVAGAFYHHCPFNGSLQLLFI